MSALGARRSALENYFRGFRLQAEDLAAFSKGRQESVPVVVCQALAFDVSGIVFDSAGKPLANASVGLTLATEPNWMRGSTRTAADGTFVLTGVQPGKYFLRVSRQLVDLGALQFDVDDADVGNLIVRAGPR